MSEASVSTMNEAAVIAEIYARTRQITRFFLNKVPADKFSSRPVAEGRKMNSAQWILGHLIQTEGDLGLRGTGGSPEEYPWLDKFTFGSTLSDNPADHPSKEELMQAFDTQEQLVQKHIRSLSDEDLGKETGNSWLKTYRDQLYHMIRHEGSHAGHLGWIAAIYGADTP